ncbi:conserved hypothetical protein [Bosea sp. 62]|uniref:hypothetical protein n=1 Tax=unclassified Bosea (in: a-proteobacteria) TaxID=2653178 RepID=UPI001253D2B4|nr:MULTISPECIES: hypothetical protein [unclassified Bosea (in: a-proteobacteria)]CAD5255622.1 conserved hypothetical protein [Bosea sp. 21B]CAD5284598.1 conserved hypothetical protein [Bosea sp. 7B]CAD5301689.1 conserved hypothetical protein [Bosea sp. 46]VVT57810.1 conserved hypothetical protein [Bosea sp. EC-HK365B]VXB31822.1 conserved hypothetical protein [Bosea sp. 29B]
MHAALKDIPARIFNVAVGALIQANQHAVYYDPGMDHWTDMSVLNASMAGELFLKAIIAKEHPLLIFRDLFQLDNPDSQELNIEHLIETGKTYNFEHLPKLLWVSTGERLPDIDSFNRIRKARNAIQHFCSPSEKIDLRYLSLEFLYKNVDPLINRHFGICAIEYHEDTSIGYDYVVDCLIRNELLFSVPNRFKITEIDLVESISKRSQSYKHKLIPRLAAKGVDVTKIKTANRTKER